MFFRARSVRVVLPFLAILGTTFDQPEPEAAPPKPESKKLPEKKGSPIVEGLDGLLFEMREGHPESEAITKNTVATGTSLADAEIEALLKRLPAIDADRGDVKSFALRESSLPPPKTGTKIADQFPSKDSDQKAPKVE